MKITITEEMREALRRHAEEKLSGTFGSRVVQALRLTRLVAQAVEEEERKERICWVDMCAEERTSRLYCAAHAAEYEEERRQTLADREAGKPCGACLFVGDTCGACAAEREAGDA